MLVVVARRSLVEICSLAGVVAKHLETPFSAVNAIERRKATDWATTRPSNAQRTNHKTLFMRLRTCRLSPRRKRPSQSERKRFREVVAGFAHRSTQAAHCRHSRLPNRRGSRIWNRG